MPPYPSREESTCTFVHCCFWGVALLAEEPLRAQAPPRPDTTRAIDATIGNQVLQLRYLTDTPLTGIRSNLDYGVLLSESREFIGSTAWMFDTDLNVLPRLTFQVGPQGYLGVLLARLMRLHYTRAGCGGVTACFSDSDKNTRKLLKRTHSS
jgi:hypothetical protein